MQKVPFQNLKEKLRSSLPELQKLLHLKNALAVPRFEKVVVNAGVGRNRDPKRLELIGDRLAKITGQKPAARGAKKSIASFKLRQGDTTGIIVTLRGKRMYDFLDRLVHVAIPRTRDFQGIDPSSIDEVGNLTIGVKEHTVFPETADEDLKDVFGFAVTIVTSAKNRQIAEVFFRTLGFPLKR